MKHLFDLSGKVGVIAGGGGKMGAEFASTLLLAGARVALVDSSQENLNRTRKFLFSTAEASGWSEDRLLLVESDVSEESSVQNAIQAIQAWSAKSNLNSDAALDFYIHNTMGKPAGYYKPLENYDLETWNDVIGANVTSAFLLLRGLLPSLLKRKTSSVVLTSSIYGVVGPDQRIYAGSTAKGNIYGTSDSLSCPPSYSVSKGALISFSRYLATTYGGRGLRSNVLTPGGVEDGQEASFIAAYRERVPLGRMAQWSDYNGAILFLVSEASSYMTGTNLILDGGWSAW